MGQARQRKRRMSRHIEVDIRLCTECSRCSYFLDFLAFLAFFRFLVAFLVAAFLAAFFLLFLAMAHSSLNGENYPV